MRKRMLLNNIVLHNYGLTYSSTCVSQRSYLRHGVMFTSRLVYCMVCVSAGLRKVRVIFMKFWKALLALGHRLTPFWCIRYVFACRCTLCISRHVTFVYALKRLNMFSHFSPSGSYTNLGFAHDIFRLKYRFQVFVLASKVLVLVLLPRVLTCTLGTSTCCLSIWYKSRNMTAKFWHPPP